jgi:hypothetical protein
MVFGRRLPASSFDGLRSRARRAGGGLVVVAALAGWASTMSASAQQSAAKPAALLSAPVQTLDTSVLPPGAHVRPLTPSTQQIIPRPPAKPGCRHFEGGQWVEIQCVPTEELRGVTPPQVENSIQSTAHSVPGLGGSYTTPIIWSSVAVNFLSAGGGAAATETDTTISGGSVPNQFSIQNNTNYFVCGLCSNDAPFAPIIDPATNTPMPYSGSQAGDTGWVQFTYQNYLYTGTQPPSPQWNCDTGVNPPRCTVLCVWQIDQTIAHNDSQRIPTNANSGFANGLFPGYNSTCVAAPPNYPLTGSGAAVGTGEVIGYIDCPNSGSNVGCMLQVVGYLPWAGSGAGGFYNTTASDELGLGGAWTDVSGTILGEGGGSEASFTNTQIQQVLQAFSCYAANTGNQLVPSSCPPPNPPWLAPLVELTAAPTLIDVTGETNSLINGPVTFSCADFNCWLSYDSFSRDCVKTASCLSSSPLFSLLGCPTSLCSLTIAPGQTNVGILGQASATGWPNPESINVFINNLPIEVTATWTQTSKDIPGVPYTGVVDFSAGRDVDSGTSLIPITASGGDVTATTYLSLTVAGVCQPVTTCYPGQCGAVPNGCSGTIGCGGCPTGKTCGANNVCISRNTCPPGTHDCGNGVCTKSVCQ